MKLIIDIDEDDYEYMKNGYVPHSFNMFYAIKNGTPLEQIRQEIERLHYHPKLDYIKNDEVVEMALEIIDKYKAESEG